VLLLPQAQVLGAGLKGCSTRSEVRLSERHCEVICTKNREMQIVALQQVTCPQRVLALFTQRTKEAIRCGDLPHTDTGRHVVVPSLPPPYIPAQRVTDGREG